MTSQASPNSERAKILLVDDDQTALRGLASALTRRGPAFDFIESSTASGALERARAEKPEAAVVDLSLDPSAGPESGLELLRRLTEQDPTMRVLVLTGHGTEEFGIRSLREGAASFLVKPANTEHLLALLNDAVSYARLRRRMFCFTEASERLTSLTGLTTRSAAMEPVLEAIAFAASNRQPVILVGETGTGKGIVAHAIHRAAGNASAPFIRFQPRFGTPDLVSSELFGHERGAFTGAAEQRRGLVEDANKGTLFLDEVDELPAETQIQLLNVLQAGMFRRVGSNKEQRSDFRLISATNRPLDESVKKGKLRQDFYHRVAHFTISVPPLRERLEDIPQLANLFLNELVTRERLPIRGFAPEVFTKLARHPWPGNVRELQAAVENGVYRANFEGRPYVEATDVTAGGNSAVKSDSPLSFRSRVEEFERKLIDEALEKAGGNQSKAAEMLQLERSTLRRILKRDA